VQHSIMEKAKSDSDTMFACRYMFHRTLSYSTGWP